MNKEELEKEIREFLSDQTTAAVATVSADSEPKVSTMYFCIDDELNFYFLTAKNSKKLKNVGENNNVAVAVGFGPATITVQAGGTMEVVSDQDDLVDKIFGKIKFHSLDQWPVLHLEKEGIVLLKMTPKWLTLLNFDKEGHPNTYSHDFHKFI